MNVITKVLVFIFLFLSFFQDSFALGRLSDRKIQNILEDKEITDEYSAEAASNLIIFVEDMMLEKKYADEDSQKFLQHALSLLNRIKSLKNDQDRLAHYLLAKRVVFTVRASQIKQGGIPPLSELVQFPFQFRNSAPYLDQEERNKKLKEDADDESKFLVTKNVPQKEVKKDELHKMTPLQVADLDIPFGHPAWRNDLEKKHGPKDYWKYLEEWNEKEVWKQYEHKNDDVEKYSLDKARRVLFIGKIKDTATAPKVTASDAYGEKWKVKWGMEVQTTPMANRLYIKLGGRYADMAYANAKGGEDFVLLLEDPKKKGDCESINSLALFKRCLMISKYKFNADPYIYHAGLITEQNAKTILKNLAKSGEKKYALKNLIGRTYVTFRESAVVFQSRSTQVRGGPATTDILGAGDDRVARSLMLFHMWIANHDAKDDNNRSAIVHGLFPGVTDFYVEYTHDLGASMGCLSTTGLMNCLKVGKKFARYGILKKSKVVFNQPVLFRPKAWKSMTYADALWMARKIAAITNEDLRDIAKSSQWPAFLQEAFVYKMAERRDRIAQLYEIEIPRSQKGTMKHYGIDLSTKELRKSWAQSLGINLNEMEKLLYDRNLIKNNGQKKYIDWPLLYGKTEKCKYSVIVNMLERELLPTGISRRVERMHDDKPLSFCPFKGK